MIYLMAGGECTRRAQQQTQGGHHHCPVWTDVKSNNKTTNSIIGQEVIFLVKSEKSDKWKMGIIKVA